MTALTSTPSPTFVTSADGTKIYTNVAGDPKNQCIVFIHGALISSAMFDPIFQDPKWSEKYYLIRYDLRGHGASDKPDDEASWESKRHADDYGAVVKHYGIVKPYVAAWSMGVSFLTDILSFHPASNLAGIINIAGIPFIGPWLFQSNAAPLAPQVMPGLAQTSDVALFQTTAEQFVAACCGSLSHDLRRACLGDIMSQPRSVFQRLLARTNSEAGFLRAGRELGLPLLVLSGGRDKLVNMDVVLKALDGWKDLKVVAFPEGEHVLWNHRPDEFRAAVLAWIVEHSGRR